MLGYVIKEVGIGFEGEWQFTYQKEVVNQVCNSALFWRACMEGKWLKGEYDLPKVLLK